MNPKKRSYWTVEEIIELQETVRPLLGWRGKCNDINLCVNNAIDGDMFLFINIQKDVKNEKASPRHTHRSLITRSLALARRHPEFIKPYARLVFQRKVAVYYERRFRNGYSSLPARIQIHNIKHGRAGAHTQHPLAHLDFTVCRVNWNARPFRRCFFNGIFDDLGGEINDVVFIDFQACFLENLNRTGMVKPDARL